MNETSAFESGHRLRLLVDHLPSMVAYWDRDLRCLFANRAYEKWFGVDPDTLLGTSIRDLLGPSLFALNEPHINAVLRGEEQLFERFVPGPDGGGRHSLASYIPDTVDGKVVGFMVQVTEVTRLKEAESALRTEMAARERANELLRKSEAALRQAQRLGSIGSWEWEVAADLVTWSEELYRIFGCDPARLPPSYAEQSRLYRPESWVRLQAAVEHTLRSGEPYIVELEYIRPDGHVGWLESRGEAERDETGNTVALRGVSQEITLRRQLEDARAERDRAHAVGRAHREIALLATEAAELGLWRWDPRADRIAWENERPLQILGTEDGTEPIEAMGALAELIHPDDLGAFRDAVDSALGGEGRFRFMGRLHRRSDRQLRWVDFNGRRQPSSGAAEDSLLGTLADITECKRDEEQALATAEVNAKFRDFFDQGSYFAGVLTLDGTVIDASRSCIEGCGFAREDVLGRKFWDCGWWNASPVLMAIARDAAREAAQGRPFRCETPYFIADGSERFVELVVNPVKDDAGRVKFLAPAGADITDLKRTERALRRLAAELAEVDRRKTEFLATLAHELRNPLTPIRHALTLLANPRNAPATIESLRQMMERQVANLVRLVDDLLDLARINSGKINLLRERVELAAIVADAMEISRPHIEAAWHAFVLDLPEPPVWLDVDRTRIAQVLSNLLNNAAKYTPVNGRIGLSARRDGDEIVISVTDNGIGIAPESLDTLFQMFAQVADVHDERGGLGVGLSLVRSVVELHGGTVRATSPGLGKGSTFTVRLPVQDAPASRGSTLNRAEPADT